jgi:predicted amidohydrolase
VLYCNNTSEYCPHEDDDDDKYYLFNTNVVFNRTGAVINRQAAVFIYISVVYKDKPRSTLVPNIACNFLINRYRKINLDARERQYLSPALKPELGMFTTDFGVTFGHMIGYDLLFQVPAMQLVEKHNISDILVPNKWTSEVPFLAGKTMKLIQRARRLKRWRNGRNCFRGN